ncbi:hypothetical protein [Sagittula salina]|uniref:Uncharacterized protein n=1 Tax=Sagittula salina TaxID=2820268 RepID=A0A940MTB3_9RHOB|nr:hypothetical protein [Sagittula salina]MBP0484471.1 hypothetical protein [Sagittula salina]
MAAFLDLPLEAPDFGRNINPSPKSVSLSETARRQLAERFRDACAFGVETFGAEQVRTCWPTAKALGI